MTDNEIIKAIWHCLTDLDCLDCPYVDYEGKERCDEKVLNDLCDLINRQKSEIEKCENIIRLADKTIEKQGAEIERLNGNLFTVSNACKQRRDEAVKEFAERFENKLNCILQHHFTLAQVLYDLDKTKKEMVGENNG